MCQEQWVTFNIICDLLVDRRIAKWNLLDKLIGIFKVWSNVTPAAFARPLFTEEICTVGRQLVSSLRYLSSGGSFLVWRSIDWYQFLSYSSILLCYKCRSVLGLCRADWKFRPLREQSTVNLHLKLHLWQTCLYKVYFFNVMKKMFCVTLIQRICL